jgi:hypothetical protein
VKATDYEDHSSQIRLAREEARVQLPCRECGSAGEPALRRPRYLSEAWYRSPDSFFGCRGCGRHLARIEGPAASRPSEVAIDGIPDPAGTLHAFIIRDPLAPLRFDPLRDAALSIQLSVILGPPLAGIELRSQMPLHRRGAELSEAPFAFTRHGLPWVVWQPVAVDDAEQLPESFEQGGAAGTGLRGLLAVDSVEAAFAVAIDPKANWRSIRVEPAPPAQTG